MLYDLGLSLFGIFRILAGNHLFLFLTLMVLHAGHIFVYFGLF